MATRIFLAVSLAMLAWAPAISAQTLRIYHIDVEQADATLFVAPGGQTLLVDSGRNGHGDRIRAVMADAGVTRIDFFVATHYHADHYGGIDDLVNSGVTVSQAFDRGDKNFLPQKKLDERTYKDYQTAVGEDAIHITRGMTIPLDPLMTVTAISSGGVVLGEQNPAHGHDENDMSVSLLITFGNFSYFVGGDIVGGDIHTATENKIAARDLVTDISVYQADHHGSNTSSSVEFITDLSPQVVIISNGSDAGYRHPRQVTLDNLANLSPPPSVFQTNKYLGVGDDGGNVADQFIADPETSDKDGTILVTVDLSAGSFIVSYGTGSSHSFAIGSVGASVDVVIQSLLPNPVGSDRELEEVSLLNKGPAPVSLAGWRLADLSGAVWSLTEAGTIQPGSTTTIRRNGKKMSLNNGSDEIRLIDSGGNEKDRFAWSGSQEGIVIGTGH